MLKDLLGAELFDRSTGKYFLELATLAENYLSQNSCAGKHGSDGRVSFYS